MGQHSMNTDVKLTNKILTEEKNILKDDSSLIDSIPGIALIVKKSIIHQHQKHNP